MSNSTYSLILTFLAGAETVCLCTRPMITSSLINDLFMQTVSTILGFFLAMLLYPDVQKRAQEEIDEMVGNSRLPNYADRSKLPYVSGLVLECLRWNPVVPLGQPHMSSSENVYNGMRIPKKTTMIVNAWQVNFSEDQ